MIRRLRLKFIAVTMGTLLLVFGAIILVLNLSMQQQSSQRIDGLLLAIAQEDGYAAPQDHEAIAWHWPKEPYGRDDRSVQVFYVRLDGAGEAISLNTGRMFDVSDEDALAFAQRALAQGREEGTLDNLQFRVMEKDYGHIIVFAERSIEARLLSELTRLSLLVMAVSAPLLLGLALLLSRWAVRPVQAAFDRQRQFVSDASHELKTPLTIISANADVLENDIGENRWLTSIKGQTARMSRLVQDLLALARTDEGDVQRVHATFDLSQAVLSAALSFESRIYEDDKTFTQTIEPGIAYSGDEEGIRQVVAILLDNAVKHASDHGEVSISLARDGAGARIRIYNTGEGVPEAEQGRLFERFYRSDASRSRDTGGFGLGLSIAQAIVTQHKGRIVIDSEPGKWVAFTVVL